MKDVDTALMRPGRCFAKINIPKITIEEANVVRKELGYDDFDLTHLAVDGKVSLAEAIEEMRIIEEAKNVKDKLLFTSAAAPLMPF